MLNSLHIENIAVIEKTDIDFYPGLNVLTGETGAGKSIIIDSIGALMGSKISHDIIRSGMDYALVSGCFSSEPASRWLVENDIPVEDELIILRRFSADGRNSCKVNGVPVTVSQLRSLSSSLIDIHGQNDGRALLDEKTHLNYLDKFGNYSDTIEVYAEAYRDYQRIRKEIDQISLDDIEKARLVDSLTYQIKELSAAEIKPGEYDTVCARRDLLRNSEKLTEAMDESLSILEGDSDANVSVLLQNVLYCLQRAASFAPELETLPEKIKDASFLISDVSETLSDFREGLDFSEEEYNSLENRISQLSRLFRKYGKEEQELLEYLEASKKKLSDIEYSDDLLLQLNKDLNASKGKCLRLAEQLTVKRREASQLLEKRISEELKDLNMPSVSFIVDFIPIQGDPGFNSCGNTDVRFIMAANAGEPAGRISKIASGGELSRIMLALKNVFAENDLVPSMIFDEIDTGVSGRAGQKVAEKLYCVSKKKQVMCVTHLPQIAAMADHQFLIQKNEVGKRTFTQVEELDSRGREKELARLYGGDNITELTVQSAAEQLKAAESFKKAIII